MAKAGRRQSGAGGTRRAARWGAGLLRRLGWRRGLIGAFLLGAFAFGFYLANLYSNISLLIEQRRAALTSAVYSAPMVINVGDEVGSLHLIDRLQALSYSRVETPSHPGEYSIVPGVMTIYVREFSLGTRGYPSTIVRLRFAGDRIAGIANSFGVATDNAVLEPEVIGRLLADAPADRVEVSLGELKPYLVKGLLATEDRYFYYHFGFDPIRIIEAAVVDFHSHRLSQGASTITQQLARTFIEKHTRSFSRKFRELSIAVVIEMRLSKDQILERYINDVPMGEYDGTPIYGLPLAARDYFNKDVRDVTPDEAATLIGMIQAPTLYDPRRHPDYTRTRRDTVLALMRRSNVIDEVQYADAVKQPIVTVKAPGLRRAPYFTDYVIAQVSKLPAVNGHLAGLKVYTTLEPELQAVANEAVEDNLEALEQQHQRLRRRSRDKKIQGSLVAMDPRDGAIVAMVGGRDYVTSQFNRAVDAQRQPGSAFKPIVYLTALDPALSPLSQPVTLSSILPDKPMSFGGWTPADYERTYQGQVTVEDALADSLNIPTAYLGSLLGTPTIIRTAHAMGINENLPNYLPISIGAADMTLLELTSAYQVFASGGVERPPYAITSVVDGQGHLIYEYRGRQRRLMSHAIAYLMTGALRGVLQFGTAASAEKIGLNFDAAGKTGTTDDYRDAYFIGYTRQLVCGVWVGFDQPESIGLTGAQAALPGWVHFMTKAVRQPQLGFGPPPGGITMVTVDPTSGGIATPSCPRTVSLPYLSGTEPTQQCTLHGGMFAGLTHSPVTTADSGAAPDNGPAPAAQPGPPAHNGFFGAVGNFFGSVFGGKQASPTPTPTPDDSSE
jgi:penicillin-binding protein 1B